MQRGENPYNRGIFSNIYEVCYFKTQSFEFQDENISEENDVEQQPYAVQMGALSTSSRSTHEKNHNNNNNQQQQQQQQKQQGGLEQLRSDESAMGAGGHARGLQSRANQILENENENENETEDEKNQEGSQKQEVVMDVSLGDVESQSSGAELESPKNRGNRQGYKRPERK
eukprot:TRINITY_DN3023_c1_g2_i1.p2 TRINITY_DN3023_c1_g2~~TRINITY_DN3023_c1_g2_i1.p2  ORF type:complete len:188 (+),score=51.77 TRINITY_DN3023_c1_g2_i1:53-565(+)